MGSIMSPVLLDKIDQLFACGVGEYIALPQLVVVGDQSSGKSSVLEGITNLPFPRDSGLCTRFATQITFRRASSASITISIIPAKDASKTHIEKVSAWKSHTNQELDPETFTNIMKEVHKLMGLGDDTFDIHRTFSEDILKLEVCGPECQHFSVVDVPGIFRAATKGVTTLEDAQMVKSMVHRYMANKRSVMLAVVAANVDIATQEILTMAEEADPGGNRTLGVLTKPDLVDRGAEPGIVKLFKGERHPLTLGWCLVRNLGQQEAQDNSSSRASVEKAFFRDSTPWNTLDKDRVGVGALRDRLQEVLANHIRREFSNVKRDLQSKLNTARYALAQLGAKRDTPEEQRNFILDVSMRFQDVVNMALASNYTGNDWFDKHPDLLLVTAVVNRTEEFGKIFQKHGHRFDLGTTISDANTPVDEDKTKDLAATVKLRTTTDQDDLQELIAGDSTMEDKIETGIIPWLEDLHRSSRGFELGTFDKYLLTKAMKVQSTKWEPLAQGYILDIIHLVHAFMKDLMCLVCPDEKVRQSILSMLTELWLDKYHKAMDHMRFLLEAERSNPQTVNHYFNDNLQKSRQERLKASLEKYSYYDNFNDEDHVISLSQVMQIHPMSNATHTVFEIHDILGAYYKVARKRFVDNVCMQAADFQLVTGPENPMKLFSPGFVVSLTTEQLEEIAGEDAALKRKRANLVSEMADLERGKKTVG